MTADAHGLVKAGRYILYFMLADGVEPLRVLSHLRMQFYRSGEV